MKRLLAILMSAILFSTLVVGCKAPAKKPEPTPPAPKAPRTTPAPKTAPRVTPVPARKPAAVSPMPTSSREMHKLATKLAGDAAKVPGVKKATVVLSGTVAYVGLDLKANVEAARTNTIKKDVADKVKKADKRLTSVIVTSDVDTVTRIKKVATGIGQGKPVTSFAREITEIGRRIAPKTK